MDDVGSGVPSKDGEPAVGQDDRIRGSEFVSAWHRREAVPLTQVMSKRSPGRAAVAAFRLGVAAGVGLAPALATAVSCGVAPADADADGDGDGDGEAVGDALSIVDPDGDGLELAMGADPVAR